jgi:hypothetical protein
MDILIILGIHNTNNAWNNGSNNTDSSRNNGIIIGAPIT